MALTREDVTHGVFVAVGALPCNKLIGLWHCRHCEDIVRLALEGLPPLLNQFDLYRDVLHCLPAVQIAVHGSYRMCLQSG